MENLSVVRKGASGLAAPCCPGCGAGPMEEFYSFDNAPVHSVLVLPTRPSAISYPKGEIRLGFCKGCGFISNTAYRGSLQEYSDRCEESQGFSGVYNGFARGLAEELIERHGLKGRHIIEIGCGKGEFLALLCELGGNTGTGFDPAFVEGRLKTGARIDFIKDFYSEAYSGIKGDFIVCKMTLEHIHAAREFLLTLRRSVEGSPSAVLFFQVPDTARILRELAFWDVYYEHCSYFTTGSLARLFAETGFEVLSMRKDYGGQYIMLEARPSEGARQAAEPFPELEALRSNVEFFSENVVQKIFLWRHKLREFSKTGYRTVLWGSGSKGVAFLTTLGITDEIGCVVDINPYRHGSFMAGTGHEIVPPEALKTYAPDAVVLMNPVYREEVEGMLTGLGVGAEVLTV